MSETHKGLPVFGYVEQPQSAVDIVNGNKQLEERVLRKLDRLVAEGRYDPRWLAIARTQIEQGFMALNRAVFRPERVRLPEDDGEPGAAA